MIIEISNDYDKNIIKNKKIISRVFVTDKEYDNKDNHTHLLEIN
jgi:hypothetical protein